MAKKYEHLPRDRRDPGTRSVPTRRHPPDLFGDGPRDSLFPSKLVPLPRTKAVTWLVLAFMAVGMVVLWLIGPHP